MLRFKGSIEYADGETVEFTIGNVAMAAWERYASRHKLPMGKDSPPVLSSLVIAHFALHVREGFDAWAETVEGVELVAIDAEGNPVGEKAAEAVVPPTLEAASTA